MRLSGRAGTRGPSSFPWLSPPPMNTFDRNFPYPIPYPRESNSRKYHGLNRLVVFIHGSSIFLEYGAALPKEHPDQYLMASDQPLRVSTISPTSVLVHNQ